MLQRHAELEKQYWLQTKAGVRGRFIRRRILVNLLIWLIVMSVLELLHKPFSLRNLAFVGLVTFPLFLLGGYLTGKWEWQDFEKKYPE